MQVASGPSRVVNVSSAIQLMSKINFEVKQSHNRFCKYVHNDVCGHIHALSMCIYAYMYVRLCKFTSMKIPTKACVDHVHCRDESLLARVARMQSTERLTRHHCSRQGVHKWFMRAQMTPMHEGVHKWFMRAQMTPMHEGVHKWFMRAQMTPMHDAHKRCMRMSTMSRCQRARAGAMWSDKDTGQKTTKLFDTLQGLEGRPVP